MSASEIDNIFKGLTLKQALQIFTSEGVPTFYTDRRNRSNLLAKWKSVSTRQQEKLTAAAQRLLRLKRHPSFKHISGMTDERLKALLSQAGFADDMIQSEPRRQLEDLFFAMSISTQNRLVAGSDSSSTLKKRSATNCG
ncbi:hypothetical protein EYR38_009147 [Pleurotus pulmonarius]|nr:hypothetical protein EYR38_009147 [Pleurotus pulmonarius]